MNKILPYILMSLIMLSCKRHQYIKSKTWTVSFKQGDSLVTKFSKLERFDRKGELIYDSSIHPEHFVYGVKRYESNKIVFEHFEIEPHIHSITHFKYLDNQLKSQISISNDDTTILNFNIKSKNKFGKALRLELYDRSHNMVGYEKRSYKDSILVRSFIYIRGDTSFNLIRSDFIKFKSDKHKEYQLTKNHPKYGRATMDSITYDYDETGLICQVKYFRRANEINYSLVDEKHYYRKSNYLYKYTILNYGDNQEKKFNAQIEWW